MKKLSQKVHVGLAVFFITALVWAAAVIGWIPF